MSQANCILTLELDVELLESGSRAARCIVRLIFHKTGQLGGWPGCLPSLTKWMYEQNLMKWCWPNRKVNVTYGPNGEAFENHLTVYRQVRCFACSYLTNVHLTLDFLQLFFFQNESTFIFSQQHQNLTWSLISPLNLIWWERRLEIAFEACGHPHPGSAHHKIVASCKFWSPSSSTCWQVTIAHIRPIWAHFGYLCTFWCRCTFTDLNIMRWCTTLTNMRYATII